MLGLISIGPGASAQTYVFNQGNFPVGTNPQWVAVGDFNGDGKSDLAVVNNGDTTVSILLGKADGTFMPHVEYPVGNYFPNSVAVGDFNGDGKLDLAVTLWQQNAVVILLGNGDGTFQSPVSYDVGEQPAVVIVADFNGDGALDLAVTKSTGFSGDVAILLGTGDGTFAPHVDYPAASGPYGLAAADVNGDGKLDLVVATGYSNAVSVYLGNGDGTFKPYVNSTVGTMVQQLSIGDFNGDGKLDMAVVGYNSSSVSVLLGNGDGTFQAPAAYGTGGSWIVAGDFNNDGKLDLAVSSNYGGGGEIDVLLGNGDGTFQQEIKFGAGAPGFLTTGDFNGDGKLDLAAVNNFGNGSSSISVLLGNGDGSFISKSGDYATGYDPYGVVAVDLNGDGKPDLAVANIYDSTISVLLNSGGGVFQPRVDYPVAASPAAVVAGDFNRDGKMDLAVLDQNCPSSCGLGLVSILLGNGDGTFQAHRDYAVGNEPGSLAAGDFNNDGNLDLVVANYSDNTVSILLGNGNGTFQAARNLATGQNPAAVAVGDLNGDGKLDVVTASALGVSVFLGKGDGTFQPRVDYLPQSNGWANTIVVADFNLDGRLDVLVGRGNTLSVYLGNGDGTLQASLDTPVMGSFGLSNFAVRDFNGDGKLDVAFINQVNSNNVGMVLGNGDGTFQSPLGFVTLFSPTALAGADFDGNGSIDLAVANRQTDKVSVLLNKPVIAFYPPALSFGNQVVGSAGLAQSVTFYNPSGGPLAFSSIAANGDFAATNDCTPALAVGGNCIADVTFSPTIVGSRVGMLTLVDNAGSSPQVIPLTGTGFTGPGVLPSPPSLSFADQEVTTTSATATLTITNNGVAVLAITSVVATGNFAQTNDCVGSINPGGNCTISVTFTPTVIGKRSGKITINDNAWNSPQTVNLAGKGVGPQVGQSPSSLTFANQIVGTTSAAQTVTISNNGHSPLSVISIIATGNFSQTNICSGPVAPGATCAVSVSFTPLAGGTTTGTLTVTSNASNSPNVITLTGTGLAAAIYVSPLALDFGYQLVGITSASQPVTISNFGDLPLIISSIPTTGDFAQTNTCAGGVAPLSTCTVNVTFAPSALGPGSGTLTFVDNAPGISPVVSLSGTGTNAYSVPAIYQILPPEAVAGGPAFTLTVDGTGFGPASVVNWNGSPRTTTFVNGGQLTAAILASDLATVGTPVITVVNPSPGGISQYPAGFDVITASPTLTFSKTDFAVGQGPEFMAMGDFNGDGKIDLAVPNYTDETVSILLGKGDGTFQAQVTYATGIGPMAAVTGDFNHDGKLDLAVANDGCPPSGGTCYGGSVSIFLGNGDGTFGQASTFNTGIVTNTLASGDFNRDGRVDLAVGAYGNSGGEVYIYLGNGDGTFQTGATYHVGAQNSQPPGSIVAADFNGDGKLDLAAADGFGSNNVSILMGNGDGTFQSQVQYATGLSPNSIAVADFNNDGKLDLAVADDDPAANSVSILLGNGDGTFRTHVDYPTGVGPASVTTGDFNGDGKLDLAAADPGSNTVSILLGNGDGTFRANQDFVVGVTPLSVVARDFNGDGTFDLAVANWGSNTVSVLLQAPAVVTLSSASVSFGNQALGTASAAQSVTLTNTGSGILHVSSIAISGLNGGDFGETNSCGTSVAPTASCTISVTFTPTAPGVRSGTLTITDNAAGSPHTIALNGTGAGPGAALSPASLTFAAQVDNTPSAAQTVTLTNSGTAALTITSVAASGDFAATNTCGSSVAAGANCAIHVTFTPTTAGSRSGTLTITDNAGGSPQTAALSGTGTDFTAAPATGSSTSATVSAGGTATYTLAFTGTPGFTGTVSLTCGGAPTLATCTVSPSSLPLNGTTAANATVSVSTTARSIVAPRTLLRPPTMRTRPIPIWPWVALAMLALYGAAVALRASQGLALLPWAEHRLVAARWRLGLATGLLFLPVLATMAMPACGGGGGGGGGGNPGTPVGTYTLTVTSRVTSGTATLTHTTNLTLTVN